MSLLPADLPLPKFKVVVDPSPARHPPLTDQSDWCKTYVNDMRLLSRTNFLRFSKFKVMGREHGGPAELIRLLLTYASIPFEDLIIRDVDWKCLMCKLPYGNLPVLWVDHNVYGEVNSIVRLLAKSLWLNGATQREAFVATAVLNQVTYLKESEMLQDAFEELQERADDNVEKALNYLIPQHFKFWESHVQSSPGPFILGSGISIADLAIYDFISQYRKYLPLDNILVKFKHLEELYMQVREEPTIEEYNKNKLSFDTVWPTFMADGTLSDPAFF